jgi:hypothetical protein
MRLLVEAICLLRAMMEIRAFPLLKTQSVSRADPLGRKAQGGPDGPVQPSANLSANLMRTFYSP